MSIEKLNQRLIADLNTLEKEGRAKKPERIIEGYLPPAGTKGPRYHIHGKTQAFIRMNSNSYLGLAHHPQLVEAADEATKAFGVGPGAVRFIDGTYRHHIALEKQIASFVGKEAARIFNSAYTSNLALALSLQSEDTYWISDEYNHNSIIRAMRIANVPSALRAVYKHNDIADLKRCLDAVPQNVRGVCVIFDGIFSMRGDLAPVAEIRRVLASYESKFAYGVVSIIDDSHGIGAYGDTGRGTLEYTQSDADIIVGTFGKAFGVNGGFIAGSAVLAETIRQKADTYIYTNPLSVADCAATSAAIRLVESKEGIERLQKLKRLTAYFRTEIQRMGYEIIDGPHPIVPVLIRDGQKTHQLVQQLFDRGVLLVGLTFPVVPMGSETIRVQINASLTQDDLDEVLGHFKEAKSIS